MAKKPAPILKAAQAAIAKRSAADPLEVSAAAEVRRWAKGDTTLQELKGYSPEDLYQIAQHGYTLFLNGKVNDAQVVFQGLIALDPRNEYYYRALGVVYHRRGDADGAIRQFTHAITVAPRQASAFVNRAEVHISRREFEKALADLDDAIRINRDISDPIVRKARALRSLLRRRR